jgi:hypothetical protein
MEATNNINYFVQDSTWRIFKINSQEDFVRKFVVQGNFHEKVHSDVLKSFQVVEHALALSFFHYPLYDLAIDKLLRIFEMAVNLRCADLGIEKVYFDNKNKQRFKNLNQLIDELIRIGMIDDFRNILHNIRKIRNHSSHQENHTLIGTIAGQVIYPILNLINLIFIDNEIHIENQSQFETIKAKILLDRNALFKLVHEGQFILAYDIDIHDCFKKEDDWIYIFSFMPVVTDAEKRIKNHQPPDRIMQFIQNANIDDLSIQGIDLVQGKDVLIEKTIKVENMDKMQVQLTILIEADDIDAFTFVNGPKLNVDRKSQQFIHENRWVNKVSDIRFVNK